LGFTNPAGTCSVDSTFSSFSPGIQLGYSYPFPNHWVFGVETDLNFNTHQSVTFGCSCPDNPGVADQFPFKNQMQGAIKGRVGRALDWRSHTLLPYLTAGLGFAKVRLTYHNEGGDDYSNTTTKPGWLIGAGIESALGEHWSVRGEYNYADYDDISLAIPSVYRLNDPNGHGRVNLSSSAIELSINYWI
jgi:outer membrane immunogenic protein